MRRARLVFAVSRVRLQRPQLGLETEAYPVVTGLRDERQDLRQGGNAFTVHGALLGETSRVFGFRIQTADVVGVELLEGQAVDRRAGSPEPLPIRATGEGWIQTRTVADDETAVSGDSEIHLQGCHAEFQGMDEAGKGVFRHQAPRAAVALQVEGVCADTIHGHP